MPRARLLWTGLALLALGSPRLDADDLVVFPPEITLDGAQATHRVLVEKLVDGTAVADRTAEATFQIGNPNIAVVAADGTVTPVSDGVTTLTATVDGHHTQAVVTVRNASEAEPWSFRNHVLPVMTKTGCNMGACHGAAAGKNGFRLTLRGYGPELDYDVLTRQALARRIQKTRPHESLFLLKPTGVVSHGGGVRFSADSLEYRVLAEWIADGMPAPSESDARIVGLETFPAAVSLQPGESQQVLVQARYSDGRTADVTRWAKFETTDMGVARVDDQGRLMVEGHGEAAITVWYSSLVALTRVTVKYPNTIDPRVYADAPRANFIDELNLRKLQALGIPPSPPADDATFLRRAYLDATGTLPPVEVVDAFLADSEPDKRVRLVDQLLESPAYVDAWSYKWSDLLLVSSRNLPRPAMWAFYRFIRESVERNRPWNEFVREIVTARGSTLENGAGNYFVIHRDPIELTENASVAFLGLSLTCARCHNHPMEKWTQDQYYGFANLFGRVKLKDGSQGEGEGDVEVLPVSQGDVVHPRRLVPMAPEPLDGEPMPLDDPGDRREQLADWLESPDNPYFTRAIVNRVWANFFGRGLVDPEDDLRATNPPSDPALMEALVEDFRTHQYDVKHLIRLIMTSAVYARSSEPTPGNESDDRYLSNYPVKRLPAEVLLDCIATTTGVSDQFAGFPAGWRAMQLPDSEAASTFLEAFGRPGRESTCSCERSDEPSLAQALHLSNGSTLNDKLKSDTGIVAKLAASEEGFATILDQLFKSSLSRPPTQAERDRILPLLEAAVADALAEEKANARRQALEDLYWATLTGTEFLFNH